MSDFDWAALGADNAKTARELRSSPLRYRKELIAQLFRHNPRAAADIGRRLDFSWRDALNVVSDTIDASNSGTVQHWLDFYAQSAGIRRLVDLLVAWGEAGHEKRVEDALFVVFAIRDAQVDGGADRLRRELLSRGFLPK